MLTFEIGQARYQPFSAKSGYTSQVKQAGSGGRSSQFNRSTLQRQQAGSDLSQISTPGLGQYQTLFNPLKQAYLKPGLQTEYLPTDSTLGYTQLGRCAGNTHMPGSSFKRLQFLYRRTQTTHLNLLLTKFMKKTHEVLSINRFSNRHNWTLIPFVFNPCAWSAI
jgi:hypothetical protein